MPLKTIKTERIMKRLIISVMLVLTMTFSVSADTIYRLEDQWPPYIIVRDQTPSGFTVELLDAMLQKVPHINVEYKFYPWKRVLLKLAETTNSFTFLVRTEKREQEFKWVGPIYPRSPCLFKLSSRSDLHINTIEDVKPYTTGVIRGFAMESLLVNAGIEKAHIQEVVTGEQNIKKLFAGRIDFVLDSPLPMAYGVKQAGHHADEVEQVLHLGDSKEHLYFGFNKDTDDKIIQHLQKALETIKKEGRYDAIVKKYNQ